MISDNSAIKLIQTRSCCSNSRRNFAALESTSRLKLCVKCLAAVCVALWAANQFPPWYSNASKLHTIIKCSHLFLWYRICFLPYNGCAPQAVKIARRIKFLTLHCLTQLFHLAYLQTRKAGILSSFTAKIPDALKVCKISVLRNRRIWHPRSFWFQSR